MLPKHNNNNDNEQHHHHTNSDPIPQINNNNNNNNDHHHHHNNNTNNNNKPPPSTSLQQSLFSLLLSAGGATFNTTSKLIAQPLLSTTQNHILPNLNSLLSFYYESYVPERVKNVVFVCGAALEHLFRLVGASPRGISFRQRLGRTSQSIVELCTNDQTRQCFVESASVLVKTAAALRTPECKALIEECSVWGCRFLDVCGTDHAKQLVHDLGDSLWEAIELAADPETTTAVAEVTANLVYALEMEQSSYQQPQKRKKMSVALRSQRRRDRAKRSMYKQRTTLTDNDDYDTVENVIDSTLRSVNSAPTTTRRRRQQQQQQQPRPHHHHHHHDTRTNDELSQTTTTDLKTSVSIPKDIHIHSTQNRSSTTDQTMEDNNPPVASTESNISSAFDIEDLPTALLPPSTDAASITMSTTGNRSVLHYDDDDEAAENRDDDYTETGSVLTPLPPSSIKQEPLPPSSSQRHDDDVYDAIDDGSSIAGASATFYRTLDRTLQKRQQHQQQHATTTNDTTTTTSSVSPRRQGRRRRYRSFPHAAAASGKGYVTGIAYDDDLETEESSRRGANRRHFDVNGETTTAAETTTTNNRGVTATTVAVASPSSPWKNNRYTALIGIAILVILTTVSFMTAMSFYGCYKLFISAPTTIAVPAAAVASPPPPPTSPEVIVRVVREVVYALPDGTMVYPTDGEDVTEALKKKKKRGSSGGVVEVDRIDFADDGARGKTTTMDGEDVTREVLKKKGGEVETINFADGKSTTTTTTTDEL